MKLPLTFPALRHQQAGQVPDRMPATPAQAALVEIAAELLETVSTGGSADGMGALIAAALPAMTHGFRQQVLSMTDEEIAVLARTVRDGAAKVLHLAETDGLTLDGPAAGHASLEVAGGA